MLNTVHESLSQTREGRGGAIPIRPQKCAVGKYSIYSGLMENLLCKMWRFCINIMQGMNKTDIFTQCNLCGFCRETPISGMKSLRNKK